MRGNKKEDQFALLLTNHNVEFTREVAIRQHGVVRKRVDFYLPKYNLYCEVINKASINNNIKIIRRLIELGYKFTFYKPSGYKIVWENRILEDLGLISNKQIPFIPELSKELRTVFGGSFNVVPGSSIFSIFGKYR